MSNTKIEHFVPQSYLRRFTQDGKRLFSFDKSTGRSFGPTSIRNVACERYFYDLPDDNAQVMEGALSDFVDSNYSRWLDAILTPVNRGLRIGQRQKENMAFFMAIQVLRTRCYRDSTIKVMKQVEDAFLQLSEKYGKKGVSLTPDAVLNDFLSHDKEGIAKEHQVASIQDFQTIEELIQIFLGHIWIIGVNQTAFPFYTSDSPIARQTHKRERMRSYSGLRSEGIEIAFPLTSVYILALLERTFHADLESLDCWCMPIDANGVTYYNGIQVFESHRWVYSPTNDFRLAEEICREFPEFTLKNQVLAR